MKTTAPAEQELDAKVGIALQSVLDAHSEIQCCYVFGSAAKRDLKTSSDIDLAVACCEPLSAEMKATLQEDFATAFGRDVDLVDLLTATGTILRNALRGVNVLCRDTQVKYRVMRRLIYDQEDMQPLRREMMDRRRKAFANTLLK